MRALLLVLAILLPGCAPAPGLRLADGRELESLAGYWVVVNHWAVWCEPCREEIPEFNQLARTEPDLLVLGMDFDRSGAPLLQQRIARLGIQFAVVAEVRGGLFAAYPRPHTLPVTWVIGPDAVLVAQLKGPQTRQSVLQTLVDAGWREKSRTQRTQVDVANFPGAAPGRLANIRFQGKIGP